jgi:hypothetical protein
MDETFSARNKAYFQEVCNLVVFVRSKLVDTRGRQSYELKVKNKALGNRGITPHRCIAFGDVSLELATAEG